MIKTLDSEYFFKILLNHFFCKSILGRNIHAKKKLRKNPQHGAGPGSNLACCVILKKCVFSINNLCGSVKSRQNLKINSDEDFFIIPL